MYRPLPNSVTSDELPVESGDIVVSLDQVPCWSDAEFRLSCESENLCLPDPLAAVSSGAESGGNGTVSRFPVDNQINSKIYLWRGDPWNLEVDAVVNSTNEVSGNLDFAGIMKLFHFICCYNFFCRWLTELG